jgi:hypothetical protein
MQIFLRVNVSRVLTAGEMLRYQIREWVQVSLGHEVIFMATAMRFRRFVLWCKIGAMKLPSDLTS